MLQDLLPHEKKEVERSGVESLREALIEEATQLTKIFSSIVEKSK